MSSNILRRFTCWLATGLMCLIPQFAVTTDAHAAPVECAEVEELLLSKEWYSPSFSTGFKFDKTGEKKGYGRLTNTLPNGKKRYANYIIILRPLILEEEVKTRVCSITLTFLDECLGDIHTYALDQISGGIRFQAEFSIGEHTWSFNRESEEKICSRVKKLLLLPR